MLLELPFPSAGERCFLKKAYTLCGEGREKEGVITSLTPHKDNFFKICIKRLENNKKRVTFATKTKDFDQ